MLDVSFIPLFRLDALDDESTENGLFVKPRPPEDWPVVVGGALLATGVNGLLAAPKLKDGAAVVDNEGAVGALIGWLPVLK